MATQNGIPIQTVQTIIRTVRYLKLTTNHYSTDSITQYDDSNTDINTNRKATTEPNHVDLIYLTHFGYRWDLYEPENQPIIADNATIGNTLTYRLREVRLRTIVVRFSIGISELK